MIRQRPLQRGVTYVESLAALALIGMAVMISSSLLSAHPIAAQRLEARHELLRVVDAVMESVRSGALPLSSGRIASPIAGRAGVEVTLEVTATGFSCLYEVRAVAQCQVRGRELSHELRSLVWRP